MEANFPSESNMTTSIVVPRASHGAITRSSITQRLTCLPQSKPRSKLYAQ
ncbi:uncharacterized protein MELLADRAFT_93762 [Melampsora larici-populina 98AG31]|uniref:Uncharacterized protein n=1 Tax=Melampsora larici-populina (strain 98AG31 / pathotype 3-4-7) TaxID=747676 RepID=F4S559_MELLP|nr:uncharacterized protein MELLADRAFT_93762 [Melampsora larici-populina 98AG31]EGG00265.1 hypothetical protein MELLADRAFT_93762 [Melampsora larici-populina 98AG31]